LKTAAEIYRFYKESNQTEMKISLCGIILIILSNMKFYKALGFVFGFSIETLKVSRALY